MRKRKEIEGELEKGYLSDRRVDEIKIELLLDIRDLIASEIEHV